MGDKIKSNNKTTKKQYLNIAKKYYDIERRGKLDSLFKTESGKAYHNINQKVFGSVNKKDPANRVGDKSKNYGNFMGNPADRFPASRDSSGYLERSTERANSGINEYIKGNTLNVKHANNGLSYDYYDSYQANRAKEAQKTENIKTKSEVKKPEVKTPVKTNGGTVQDNEKKEALRKVENKVSRFTKTFKGASGNLYAHDPLTKETRVLDKGSKTWKPATEKEITNIAPYTKWEKGKSTTETPMDSSAVGKVDNTAVPQVNAPAYTNSTPPTNTVTPPNNIPTTKEGFLKRAGNYLKSGEGKFAMSKAKDISFDAAMVAGQYANNKQALKELEGVRIPEHLLKTHLDPSTISMNVDRGDNKTTLANSLASNNRNFSDANVAAAMRGSATSQFQGTASKINQEERNVNTQLKQATNIANSGIQGENNTSILNKANLEMQKRLEIIKGGQAANNQLLEGGRGVVAGEGARQKDRNQMAIDASSLGGRYYNRLAGTMDGTTGYQMQRNMTTDEELAAEDKLALDKATVEKPLYDSRTGVKLKNGGIVKKLSKGGKMSKLYC